MAAYETIRVKLENEVAPSETCSFDYPAGTSAATFIDNGEHVFVTRRFGTFESDSGDFSVAFGTSVITVTNLSVYTWPLEMEGIFQFEAGGNELGNPVLYATFDDFISSPTDYDVGTTILVLAEAWSYRVVSASEHFTHPTAGYKLIATRADHLTPGMVNCVTWDAARAGGTEAVDAAANKPKIKAIMEYGAENRIPVRFDHIYISAPEITLDWDANNYLRGFFELSGNGGGGIAFYSTTSFTHGLKIIGGTGDQIVSVSNIHIHDFLISQGKGSDGRREQEGDGLVLVSVFHSYVQRIIVENFIGLGIGYYGVWDSDLSDFKVQHCGKEVEGSENIPSVLVSDYEGDDGDQNTNSVTLRGGQVENSYGDLYRIGGDTLISGNGGGAQNIDIIDCKAHRRATGEDFHLDGLIGKGAVRVKGAGQSGTSLVIDGLTKEPLKHENVIVGGNSYVITAVSYASGEATLTLATSLSGSPPNDAVVNFGREVLVAGAGQTGTNLDVDRLTVAPYAGDRIWIEGLEGSYVVDSVSGYNASAGTATLVLTEALASSPADNADVEFYSRYKALIRVFGPETANNRISACQLSPQERLGLSIEDGASDTRIALTDFGGANPGRQPIYVRDDAGAGTEVVNVSFEEKPSKAADLIRDDSPNTIYVTGIGFPSGVAETQLCNKHTTASLLGEYTGRKTIFSRLEDPLRIRDMRTPAVSDEVNLIVARDSGNNVIASLSHFYSTDTDNGQIRFNALSGGSLVNLGYLDAALDVYRINVSTFNIDGKSRIIAGSGSPGGSVSAPVSSIYARDDTSDPPSIWQGKVDGAGNTGWASLADLVRIQFTPLLDLQDKDHAVNTALKFSGRPRIEAASGKLVIATGSGNTDTWAYTDGTTAITPS